MDQVVPARYNRQETGGQSNIALPATGEKSKDVSLSTKNISNETL